jgi:hypothetical protein
MAPCSLECKVKKIHLKSFYLEFLIINLLQVHITKALGDLRALLPICNKKIFLETPFERTDKVPEFKIKDTVSIIFCQKPLAFKI